MMCPMRLRGWAVGTRAGVPRFPGDRPEEGRKALAGHSGCWTGVRVRICPGFRARTWFPRMAVVSPTSVTWPRNQTGVLRSNGSPGR